MEIVRKKQNIIPFRLLHPGMVFYFLDTPQDIWLVTEEAVFSENYAGMKMVSGMTIVNIKTGALVKSNADSHVRLLNVKMIIEGE